MGADGQFAEPRGRVRAEPERDDDAVGGDDLLGPRHVLRFATALGIGRAETGLDHFHAFDLAVTDDLNRGTIEDEADAFFLGVGNFAARPGHIGLVAAVDAGDAAGLLPHRGAHAVHRGIAAAEHHHALSAQVHIRMLARLPVLHFVDVADQVRKGFVDAGQILAGEFALHVFIGAHAEEHGVVGFQQLGNRDVAADLGVELELDAHALQHLTALQHHLFFQLERRDAVGQQATDLGVFVEHHAFYAVACQHVGAADAGGPRADDGDTLAGGDDLAQVRAPALLEGFIGNVFLDIADADRPKAFIEGAGAFTQTVLRADAPADLGQ